MKEIEWLCSLLVSAMYAGLFVTYNEGHFSRCEGPPRTRPVFRLICTWFLVILSSSSRLIGFRFFWTRLTNRFLRIRRVVRLIILVEQAITLLRGISVSFISLWYEVYQRSGKGFPSLARECWLGKCWKKSILALQHQYPERDESFRPEMKECLQSVDILEKAIVLWCCTKFGMRLGKRCLLMKDGHNHRYLFVYQGSSYRGVGFPASKGRFPQTRLDCSSVKFPGRGEELHLDKRCIHLACGLPTMANVQSVDGLSGRLTSALCNPPGMYSMGNSFMTGKGCEALNIPTFIIALSKIQHFVGVNVFLQTLIKFTILPMIPASFKYMLSTSTSRKPICTWYLTI